MTQNPAFASYLRPSEGQNLKDASRTEDKGVDYAKRMKSYNPLFRMVARIF
jgi:hypothetical protein